MIQEIYPHVFHKEFEAREPSYDDICFVCRQDTLLLKQENGILHLPTIRELGLDPKDCRSLFQQDETWYTMLKHRDVDPPEGYEYYTKHQYREFGPFEKLWPTAVAGSLNRWYTANRFCGYCGNKMEDKGDQLALICPCCGKKIRPKIQPAVIAGIRHGDRILLTRYNGPASKRVALVAGYNEIGESLEDTLRREVMEEVGLKVKNIRYYKSQPWVITDSVMVGFYCDLDGEDAITLQESELSMGTWVKREDLPPDTTHLSLTAEMIEQFRLGLA